MKQLGVGSGVSGVGNAEFLHWVWGFFSGDENVLSLNCGDGYTVPYWKKKWIEIEWIEKKNELQGMWIISW